ncbi:Panacea domain-containing protein [uncultured Brevundimonas sp.]|uniref:Panacea domain-containing protein n=1 Tax=uncultured Brevundimonas sp. TaxID=213418 RepID=UPI0025F67736|nr:Panacea domain-containing protein [uncultured Brevundimonas sp.]
MRSQPPQFDREKFKEAIWLLASYCNAHELGNVKLHKMLYFADMLAYLRDGRPITGVEYLKQKFGPTARHLTIAVRELEHDGRVRVEETTHFGYPKKSYHAQHTYVRTRLRAEDEALLREVADFVKGKSAQEISDLSHNAAWDSAAMGEIIPYFTALKLVPDEVTESDRDWAIDSARQHAVASPW